MRRSSAASVRLDRAAGEYRRSTRLEQLLANAAQDVADAIDVLVGHRLEERPQPAPRQTVLLPRRELEEVPVVGLGGEPGVAPRQREVLGKLLLEQLADDAATRRRSRPNVAFSE